MTSCVFPLFFWFFLSSSLAVAQHSGVKLRITNAAQDVLKEVVIAFLKDLLNKPWDDIPILDEKYAKYDISGLTFSCLSVSKDEIDLTFGDNPGVHFEVSDLAFTAAFKRKAKVRQINLDRGRSSIAGRGLSTTIDVNLNRDPQGHLKVEIVNCEFKADDILIVSHGKMGGVVDQFKTFIKKNIKKQICPSIQNFIPQVNSMSDQLTMRMNLPSELTSKLNVPGGQEIIIDYSVTGDVRVSANSLDIPFRGFVSTPGSNVDPDSIRKGEDPVFTQTDQMAYVGISEFFLNSATTSLHRAGAMSMTDQVTQPIWWGFLKFLQVFTHPFDLMNPMSSEVVVVEVPEISITQDKGVILKVPKVIYKCTAGQDVLSVEASCTVALKVAVEENYLILPSDDVVCTITTSSWIKSNMVKPLNWYVSYKVKTFLRGLFDKGLHIPLPEGMGFTQGNIVYQNGYLVVGGSLRLAPSGGEKVVELVMSNINTGGAAGGGAQQPAGG
ncbi:phospholipid transfer protein-like, partial [Morone saxatilis]|uniref:phospholipid transfer protein-like n=1 Tax=Morone saxatilis TaxID=34816 RepID=UPI0015E23C00